MFTESQERFRLQEVSPQVGSIADVMPLVPQGSSRKEVWVKRKQEADQRFETAVQTGNYLHLEWEDGKIRELPIKDGYSINATDELPKEQVEKIFSGIPQAMATVLAELGIDFPIPDDILDRLHFVDSDTLFNIELLNTTYDYGSMLVEHGKGTYGICLPNRLVFIDDERLKKSHPNETKRDDMRRDVGVHEAWHSIGYWSQWVPMDPTVLLGNDESVHRSGIFLKGNPDRNDTSVPFVRGTRIISEGTINTLAHRTLEVAGYEDPRWQRKNHFISIKTVQSVGLEPHARALLYRDGYMDLTQAYKNKFDKRSSFYETISTYGKWQVA